MNLFNPESKLMQIITFAFNLVLLQFLFILTSLPVFTMGASATAAFSLIKKMERDVYLPVIRTYFREFKSSFKQSTVAWLIVALAAAVLAVDIWFFTGIDSGVGKIGVIFGYLGAFFLVLECLYVFPLMAWFENSTKRHMRNAIQMALANWWRTLLLLGLVLLLGFFLWRMLQLFLLFGLTGAMYIAHLSFKRIFGQYVTEGNAA